MGHLQFVLFTTVVARNEKIQLTTKVTKHVLSEVEGSTKFGLSPEGFWPQGGDLVIQTLRVLRGENIFTVNREQANFYAAALGELRREKRSNSQSPFGE